MTRKSKNARGEFGEGSTFVSPLFRGHYLIALYSASNRDELVYVGDNPYDISESDYTYGNLCHHINDPKNHKSIEFQGKRVIAYLVDAFEDERGKSVWTFRKHWGSVYPPTSRVIFKDSRGYRRKTQLCNKKYERMQILSIIAQNGYLQIEVKGIPETLKSLSRLHQTFKRIGIRVDISDSLTESSSSLEEEE